MDGGDLLGGGGEVLRMEGGLGRGWEGGLPRLGGEAGSVPGGRFAGLRRWMEMESVFGPIWGRKKTVGNGGGQGKGLNRPGRGEVCWEGSGQKRICRT